MNQPSATINLRVTTTGRALKTACVLAGFLSLMPTLASAQPANNPVEVFQRLSVDNWITRDVSLSELGFIGPLVLGAPDTLREIYLPVPPNVPLSNGEIKFNANYMRADGGRTSLVLSLDGYPVSSRPFALEKGDASLLLGVDGSARPSGFVRLGLNWSTALGADRICTDGRTLGNVLRVEPDSRFSYRYDASAIRDLATAWGALPTVPVILVSSKNLGSDAYDSAWRMGVALERAGKRSRIVVLPTVGDVVDLAGVTIPPGLRSLPGFAGLAQGGKYKLKDTAEVGALLSLGSGGPFRADIVISDKAVTTAMTAAFDAMRTQLQAAAPEAVASYGEWRTRSLDMSSRVMGAKEVRLATLFGRPTIVVASDAGAKAAGLFSAYWNKLAISPSMIVQAAEETSGDPSAVSLKYLGGKPGSFDVLAHADWNTSFDIGAVAANGRLPGKLVLDVAASPSAARTPPVVSIFMNDILLGAKQLDANGKAERITAPIPSYALAARNLLRVSFVRQLASDRCRETPEAYPVSVLPSSHMLLENVDLTNDFNGMVSRYASGAHVMVPAAYLADSVNTLPRVIRMAASTGLSPVNARFTASNDDAMPAPGGPFLALELPLKDQPSKIKLDGGRILMASNKDKVLLDISGLNGAGVLEVVKIKGEFGLMYRNVGMQAPSMDKSLLLAQGDVAIIGSGGVLAEINSADPSGRAVIGGAQKPWMISGIYWWLLPILAVISMVVLLVFASRARRRQAAEKNNL